MKPTYRYFRLGSRRSLLFACCLLAAMAFVTGCVSDDDETKAVVQFQESSATLTTVFQAQLLNANVVEADNYVDNQVFAKGEINKPGIDASAVLNEDEIKLRISAMKALTDYTVALATLAGAKPAALIKADADAASQSSKDLSADASKVISKASKGSKTPDYSGPVSAAVGAIGDVLQIIAKHRGEEEVKRSIEKNDPQVTALYQLLSTESRELYARQKSHMGLTGITLFSAYNNARTSPSSNPEELLALGERIKQYEKDNAALSACDPAHAMHSFEEAHNALVKAILAPKEERKQRLSDVITKAKSFASDVMPLGESLQSFYTSL